MIDVHFHCLPGIDDGPETWAEAVALCRAAAADGAETLVATPHVLRGGWLNEDAGARDGLILRLNTLLGGQPAILPGCEYLLSDEAVALFERGGDGPLTGLNRSRYLLLEVPATAVPRTIESAFHELALLGAVPVIAHPERHSLFRREPEILARLVRGGAVTQITAASLLGHFGERAQAASEDFFQRGLVALVASDAHNLNRRPPSLSAARERVRRRWGSEAEEGLFVSNPEALLRSEPLPWLPTAAGVAGRTDGR
jgi:protein-tyrosine phosphatase